MDIETKEKKFNIADLLFKYQKWIPVISLIIAICAFTFQVTVLYPWHLELSEDFKALAKKIASK